MLSPYSLVLSQRLRPSRENSMLESSSTNSLILHVAYRGGYIRT